MPESTIDRKDIAVIPDMRIDRDDFLHERRQPSEFRNARVGMGIGDVSARRAFFLVNVDVDRLANGDGAAVSLDEKEEVFNFSSGEVFECAGANEHQSLTGVAFIGFAEERQPVLGQLSRLFNTPWIEIKSYARNTKAVMQKSGKASKSAADLHNRFRIGRSDHFEKHQLVFLALRILLAKFLVVLMPIKAGISSPKSGLVQA